MSKFLVFLASSGRARKFKSKRARIAFAMILSLALIISCYRPIMLLLLPKGYFDYVELHSEKFDLDSDLIYAIILIESGFDPDAVSSAGACGLMQLMPSTFEWISKKHGFDGKGIFNPENNIQAGCAYISYLSDKFPDTATMLAAYNAGEGTVSRWLTQSEYSDDGIKLKSTPYPETSNHIRKVLRAQSYYKKLYKTQE